MNKRRMVAAMAVGTGLTCAAFAFGTPRAPATTTQAVGAAPAGSAPAPMSRREYLARIVAETAARSAAEAARRRVATPGAALARPVEPATRVASAGR